MYDFNHVVSLFTEQITETIQKLDPDLLSEAEPISVPSKILKSI